jgi:PRTRC genetic system protein B
MEPELISAALVREVLLQPPPRPLLQLEAELLFLEGQYLLHWQEREGGERFKFLSPETLRLAFGQEPEDSGWLPGGILRWGRGAGGEWLVKYRPPGRHRLVLVGVSGELSVPLPGLVFAGAGERYYLWAVKRRPEGPGAPLFQAPLPNIYPGGQICFGENRPPRASTGTFEEAWRLFISSPFNGELAGGKSGRHPGDIRRQWQELALAGRLKYPLRDLVPLRRPGYSLEEALKPLITARQSPKFVQLEESAVLTTAL